MTPNEKTSMNDERMLDEAIAEFLRAASAGRAGDRQAWLDRYPAVAKDLVVFFDDLEHVDRLILPVRVERLSESSGFRGTAMFERPAAPAQIDTVDLTPKPPHFDSPRYRPLCLHSQGGMGEVWLAEDERIGRHVALKKLRPEREQQRARFTLEAQVTGQLEHPSIVPIHDVGVDDAGEPFYIMKMIQGESLTEAIREYHAHKGSGDWTSDVPFRRLLETFNGVCYAVAYAHSKGVVHRDIKPDNVMVGPYGETVVLDWGLAKVLDQPDLPGVKAVHISGSDFTATQAGAIVGSPYYMSPEGAEGHNEEIDQSSDVYLLGATLYEILTAKRPREGSSQWELIDQARNRMPTSPRTLDPRIPKALEGICRKAMAFRKHDRYETPIALADDVERFLAGEAVTAYREPSFNRLARRIRRHRRSIQQVFTILMVILLAGLAFFGFQSARALAAREVARNQLNEFYRLADEAQYFAANTDAATERVPYYDPRRASALGRAARSIAAAWGDRAELLPLAEQRAEFLEARYNLLLLMAQTELAANAQRARPREALALLDEAAVMRSPTRGHERLRSRCLELLGSPQALDRENAASDSPERTTAADYFLQGELFRQEDTGAGSRLIGDDQRPARQHLAKAVEAYQTALRRDPKHFWAQFQLGRCLMALGRGPEAVATLSGCVAMRPASPWAYSARGLASALAGQIPEALVDLDRAVLLDPDFRPARLNRGVVYWMAEDSDAALKDFDAVLATPLDKRLIEASFYRGQLLLQKQRYQEALADLSAALDARPDFHPALWLRAQLQFRLGRYDDGRKDIATYLAIEPPAGNAQGAASLHFHTGRALRYLAVELDGEAARQALLRAAEELQAAAAEGPPTAEARQHLGAVWKLLGRSNDAIAAFSQGLKLAPESAVLHNMRGWTYVADGQYDAARADFVEALRIAPDDADSHAGAGYVAAQTGAIDNARNESLAALLSGSGDYLVLHNVACIHGRLSAATAATRVEHEDLALAALKRALTLSRQLQARPAEDRLIREETEAFPDALRARPEFKQLASGQLSD